MMKRFAEGASRIFLVCGFTDFRKQIPGLVATVTFNFKLDPYNSSYELQLRGIEGLHQDA